MRIGTCFGNLDLEDMQQKLTGLLMDETEILGFDGDGCWVVMQCLQGWVFGC